MDELETRHENMRAASRATACASRAFLRRSARFSRGARPKRTRVRSWIFRHRLRLRAIYGPRPELRAVEPRSKPAKRVDGLAPGQCARRGEWFVIRPNAPAA